MGCDDDISYKAVSIVCIIQDSYHSSRGPKRPGGGEGGGEGDFIHMLLV